MKKIFAIFLLAGVTFALFPQAAGTEPKDSQPIVVGTDGQQADQTPKSTSVIRTITTKKAYTHTETIPETTTTVIAPDRVLVREGVLSWVSIGLRISADWHVTQKDGALSPLWLYGEFYNSTWGVELGVGRLVQPINTITDVTTGATVTGIAGTRNYWTVETVFKYYMPFAKWFWAGAGFAYNSYDNGFVYTTAAAYQNLLFMRSQFLWEGGLGIKVALGNGFNVVHFDPNIRVLGPLNTDGSSSVIVRLNLGFTYSFGL
jgi:hypothetical protein